MKFKPKSEMSKLLWSFTIPVLLLVALIVIAYLIYGIINADNNAKHTKKLVIEQAAASYGRFGENFKNMSSFSPELIQQFNPNIVQSILAGNPEPLHELAKNMMIIVSPAEYVAVIQDGKIIDSYSPSGEKVDPKGLTTTAPKNGYKMLGEFNNRKGDFLNLVVDVDMTKLGINAKFSVSSVIDLTAQIRGIDKYFKDQKRDTFIYLVVIGVIALILFGLLSTFWLRYLINKYVRRPVDELNTMAKEIAAGTYQGEVVVDENSDFAALQGLLRSGQIILRKLDEKA